MAVITRPPLGPTKTTISLADLETVFDTIYDEFNGNIDENNISVSSTVMVGDRSGTVSAEWTISGTMTFSTVPVFPANSIPDTALATTFSEARTYSSKQTFSGGIDLDTSGEAQNFRVQTVTSLPAPSANYDGVMLRLSSDKKVYLCDGTNWNDMTYIGSYTGGALRTYSGTVDVDDGNFADVVFKLDTTSTVVKLWMRGKKFWSAFYRELAAHSHGTSGLSVSVSITDLGHTHDVVIGSHTHIGSFATDTHTHDGSPYLPAHTHGYGTLAVSISDSGHYHSAVTTGGGATALAYTGISLSISGATDNPTTYPKINFTTSGPSAYASVASTDLGTKTSESATTGITASATVSGTTDTAGVGSYTLSTSVKTYPDSLQIQLNGTDITQMILDATGWTTLGDGTATHGFISGTGEIEIYRKVTGEVIGTGDGVIATLNYTNTYTPVKPNSVSITYTIGGIDYAATDDGAGNISGTDCSGTINYSTGEISLTFTSPPDNATDITENYEKGYCSSGMNALKIIEPTFGSGGRVVYHLDVM